MDIIVAIKVTKMLTKIFSLSAYGVRYFLGQYMWPLNYINFLIKYINKFAAAKARKPCL